jgi:hypothetical protein
LTGCDILEYDVPYGIGGSIGLYGFQLNDNGGEGGCLPFMEASLENGAFGPARVGANISFFMALSLLALNAIHYTTAFVIPQKDVVFYVLGALQQVSLAMVQLLWRNELCETYGCQRSEGSFWMSVAHVMYLAATCINLFIQSPQHAMKPQPLQQQIYSITIPLVRKTTSRSILEPR